MVFSSMGKLDGVRAVTLPSLDWAKGMIKVFMVMAEEGVKFGNELVKEILGMKQENGKKMSQYRLADAIGVTDQAVYKWVKGQSSPLRENYDKLLEYARFLELINKRRPFQV